MMQGKVVMVTGATGGIGEVAARDLARAGATIVVVSRNADKCQRTVESIRTETGNEQVDYLVADLSVMANIRHLAAAFLEKYERLDVLLNNAGAFFNERQITSDGYEKTFALNHLNYFLLTHLLLDRLKATADEQGEARIINVSSGAHYGARQGVNFDDLTRQQGYSGFGVYSETKLMNILFTYKLAQMLSGSGVTVNALHPGFVNTGFGKNNSGPLYWLFNKISPMVAISPEEGAQTSIYLAQSPAVAGVTGKYYEKKAAKRSSDISYDQAQQDRLWAISLELTGLETTTAPESA